MRTFLKLIGSLAVVCAVLFCAPSGGFAQGLGSISGTVLDATGASISSASVVLSNQATGEAITAQTHQDGLYVFPSLAPTNYKLTITAPGFKKYEQSGIVLRADQSLAINAKLESAQNR